MSSTVTPAAVDLSVDPIHLDCKAEIESPAVILKNFGFDGPAFEQYISQHCQQGSGRILMIETSANDWPHWECHTEGDEVVIILEGSGVMIQSTGDEELQIPIGAGQAVINPRGTWHTANIAEPIKALYITPARGTEHRAR